MSPVLPPRSPVANTRPRAAEQWRLAFTPRNIRSLVMVDAMSAPAPEWSVTAGKPGGLRDACLVWSRGKKFGSDAGWRQ
jgi:hypothetical protein